MTRYLATLCDHCGGTGVVFAVYDGIDDYVEEECFWCKGTGIYRYKEIKLTKDKNNVQSKANK